MARATTVTNPHFRGFNPIPAKRRALDFFRKEFDSKIPKGTTDVLLWIEHNVLDPLELPGICQDHGMWLAEQIEDEAHRRQA